MLVDEECKIKHYNIVWEVDSTKEENNKNWKYFKCICVYLANANTIINVKQHETKNRQVKTIDESWK